MDVADARAGPAQRIVETIEAQLDEVVATAVDTIWEQVPAYPASSAPELRRDLTTHVGLVFRALVTSLKEDRPARADDFPVTELWRVLAMQAAGRRHGAEVTLFDSVGFALEDYSALRLVRDCAKELGLGQAAGLIPELRDPKDLFGELVAAPAVPVVRAA